MRIGRSLLRLLLAAALLPSCIVWAPVNVGRPAGPAGISQVVVRESKAFLSPGKVVVVSLRGALSADSDEGPLGSTRNSVADLAAQLAAARKDDAVVAVVLAIDSPGGTVTASDLIHREVARFKEETGRPVIACLLDVGASGGYYVALAADEIWALPTTVTGSIGVVAQFTGVSGLFEKLGLEQRTLKSGALKDLGSPYRAMNDEERAILQGVVDSMYARFVDTVAAGRPALGRERVLALADGRIFTAQQALDAGLIDRVGYLEEAVDAVAARAGVHDPDVVGYRIGWGTPANLYAGSTQAPLGSEWRLDRLLPGLRAKILYLWDPGA